jgi:methylmalonyl-CoA/ethylmalonyl-CoA epimerase
MQDRRVIRDADFDHVALAAESGAVLQARYRGQLGGRPLAGGRPPGFIWNQLEFANGAVVEMLEPDRVEENDFLRRFLDRQGPGPHHFTFKVPDFGAALAAAEAAGYPPVGVDGSDPDWKEAFLHPKDAPGVVVQLAESHEHHDHPAADPSVPAASFDHVAHAVRSLDEGLRLFEGLLGGTRCTGGNDRASRWVELGWAGPGRLRLVEPTGAGELDDWLGDRSGRVHHLAFSVADPTAITDAVASGHHWQVEPATNFGTRLFLHADPSLGLAT